MTYPISMIPYANMAPYRELGPPDNCEFVPITPRQSTAALRDGRVYGAPVPVGDLPSLDGVVELIGQQGIAAVDSVKSVLLFSDRPFEEMGAPSRIHLTNQSSSSVRLLFLLLGQQLGFDKLPFETRHQERADGELVIGDDALLQIGDNKRPYVTDLAAKWHALKGVPFVFARWVIVKDAKDELRVSMEDWLNRFERQEDKLVEACLTGEARRMGLSVEEMRAYLGQMKRVLGPEELRGQARFLEELAMYKREPLFRSESDSERE